MSGRLQNRLKTLIFCPGITSVSTHRKTLCFFPWDLHSGIAGLLRRGGGAPRGGGRGSANADASLMFFAFVRLFLSRCRLILAVENLAVLHPHHKE